MGRTASFRYISKEFKPMPVNFTSMGNYNTLNLTSGSRLIRFSTLDTVSESLSKLHPDTLIEIYKALVYGGNHRTNKVSRFPTTECGTDKVFIIRGDLQTIVIKGKSKEEFLRYIEEELSQYSELVVVSAI